MDLTVITMTAVAPHARRIIDGAQIADVLWAAAESGDHFEHVSTSVGPGHLHLGIFTTATQARPAELLALALCRRALATSPLLSGWCISFVRRG